MIKAGLPHIDRVKLTSGAWVWRCCDENCYGLGAEKIEAYNLWKSTNEEFMAKRANDAFTVAMHAAEVRNNALCFPTRFGTA